MTPEEQALATAVDAANPARARTARARRQHQQRLDELAGVRGRRRVPRELDALGFTTRWVDAEPRSIAPVISWPRATGPDLACC